MSYHKEIVKKLNLRKQEFEERLDRVKDSLRKTHAKDWSEQAQERENEEVVEKLDCQAPKKRVHPLSYKFPYIFSNELKELCLQTP